MAVSFFGIQILTRQLGLLRNKSSNLTQEAMKKPIALSALSVFYVVVVRAPTSPTTCLSRTTIKILLFGVVDNNIGLQTIWRIAWLFTPTSRAFMFALTPPSGLVGQRMYGNIGAPIPDNSFVSADLGYAVLASLWLARHTDKGI